MKLENIITYAKTYAKTGAPYHVGALTLTGPAALCAERAIYHFSNGQYMSGAVTAGVALLNLGGIVLCEMAATVRYAEYHRVRSDLEHFGWNERIIEPKSHSFCQKIVAIVAATDCGFEKEVKEYFDIW
jgi:hypothetical protein